MEVQVGGRGVPFRAGPGLARFVPGAGFQTFTTSSAMKATAFEANFNQALAVFWRSPSGGEVTLRRGFVNAVYQLGEPYGAGPCSKV